MEEQLIIISNPSLNAAVPAVSTVPRFRKEIVETLPAIANDARLPHVSTQQCHEAVEGFGNQEGTK